MTTNYISREVNGNVETLSFYVKGVYTGSMVMTQTVSARGNGSSYDRHRQSKGDNFASQWHVEFTDGLPTEIVDKFLQVAGMSSRCGDNNDNYMVVCALRQYSRGFEKGQSKKDAKTLKGWREAFELKINPTFALLNVSE